MNLWDKNFIIFLVDSVDSVKFNEIVASFTTGVEQLSEKATNDEFMKSKNQ